MSNAEKPLFRELTSADLVRLLENDFDRPVGRTNLLLAGMKLFGVAALMLASFFGLSWFLF